jgi:hypothetical protein
MDCAESMRKILEYFEMIGGICAFCKNVERVTTSREVYCKVYGRTRPAITCRSFEQEVEQELKPEIGERRYVQG